MKKTAILLALCLTVLSGCGKVDSVDGSVNAKPFEIEKTTKNPAETTPSVSFDIPVSAPVTTEAEEDTEESTVTTARTGAVNLVKRTGVVAPPRATAPPANKVTAAPTKKTTARSAATSIVRTTVVTAVTTTASTVAVNVNDPLVTVKDDLACSVKDKGIELIRDGVVVQTIDIDTTDIRDAAAEGKHDPNHKVLICDFDFDGHDDLFIPQQIDDNNTYGVFKHYDPEKKEFTDWTEMDAIGGYANANPEEKTINIRTVKNSMEYELKVYKWEDDRLAPVSLTWQYRLNDSEEEMWNVYKDYYEYPDGVETIIRREKLLFSEDHEVLGCEEIEITRSMR